MKNADGNAHKRICPVIVLENSQRYRGIRDFIDTALSVFDDTGEFCGCFKMNRKVKAHRGQRDDVRGAGCIEAVASENAGRGGWGCVAACQ